LTQLPWFVLLGVFSGYAGAKFLSSLAQFEQLWHRRPISLPFRMALAGLLVGIIGIAFPEVFGNGYAATNRILHEPMAVEVLAGIVVAKWLATAITVGAGTVGGVFTPTLFLGAGLGATFAGVLHHGGYALDLPPAAFALVGMGAALSATTHSPLLALIIVFEISLNYTLMPPLMVACAIATLVARRYYPETVYTEPLRKRGLSGGHESDQIGVANQQTVGDIMIEPVPPLRENAPFQEIADRFLTCPNNFLPVVDSGMRLVGVVGLHDLKEYLHDGDMIRGIIAADVMRPPPPALTPDQRLSEALPVLLASELRNVPVVNSIAGRKLIGAVQRSEALGQLSEAIVARSRRV
jgi:CIC family chloride channel protein